MLLCFHAIIKSCMTFEKQTSLKRIYIQFITFISDRCRKTNSHSMGWNPKTHLKPPKPWWNGRFPFCVTDEIYKPLVLNMNRQISNWRTPKRDLSTNTKEKLFLEVILSMPWCHERRGLYWAGGSLADKSSLAKSLASKTPVPAVGRTGNDGLGSCTDIYRGNCYMSN